MTALDLGLRRIRKKPDLFPSKRLLLTGNYRPEAVIKRLQNQW